MRLIDADALLEELNEHIKSTANLFYKDALELITNAPTIQREGWVSVADRLPEFECSVLCYRESDDWQVVADYIYPAFWIDFSEGKVAHAITHWQPLPSPPTDTE